MELIIGGAYQGKLTHAVKKHGFSEAELYGLSLGFPERECACCYHLEALTKAAALEGLSAEDIIKRLEPYIKNAVVISREVGCGVVPMEPFERHWREIHGAVLRKLAEEASSVTRIFCGLPEVLK